jgi:hypothetical protein
MGWRDVNLIRHRMFNEIFVLDMLAPARFAMSYQLNTPVLGLPFSVFLNPHSNAGLKFVLRPAQTT